MTEIEKDLTDKELAEVIGPVAWREFQQSTDRGQRDVRRWAARIREMSDKKFEGVCMVAILDSARMNSFRGNFYDLDAMASACFHESKRRWKKAGHESACRGDDLYVKGYNRALANQGHRTPESNHCTCL